MKRSAFALKTLGTLALFLVCLTWTAEAQEPRIFKIIVHPDNPETELTKEVVSKIFLKKMSRWENGETAAPVDQLADSEVRRAFSEEIHGRKSSAIKSYWQQQIFSGRGVPPPEQTSDHEVMNYVRRNPAAVGYVSAATPLDRFGVKELKVLY